MSRPRKTLVYREKSDRTGDLAKALAKAQGEFGPVEKDSEAQYGRFASLKSMRKATAAALAANNLSISQEYSVIEDKLYLVTVLSHMTDQWTSSVVPIKEAPNPQQTTAYMTYMKRAAYSAMLCLAAEDDDDGEGANAAAAHHAASIWKEQHRLAKDAINAATSQAKVDSILAKVRQKIANDEMNPDALGNLELLAKARLNFLAESRQAAGPQEERK